MSVAPVLRSTVGAFPGSSGKARMPLGIEVPALLRALMGAAPETASAALGQICPGEKTDKAVR